MGILFKVRRRSYDEYNLGAGNLIGELGFRKTGDQTTSFDSGGSETTTKGEADTILKVCGTYTFSELVTGLASYTMSMHPEVSANSTKAYTNTNIFFGARFNC